MALQCIGLTPYSFSESEVSKDQYLIRRSYLLTSLFRSRAEFTQGTLSTVLPMHCSNILFLVGGGPSPLYSPNKVIVWDDALGREVAELEFRERVRGLACRRGWLVVALRRRVVAFEVGTTITRRQEWDTNDNQRGVFLFQHIMQSSA